MKNSIEIERGFIQRKIEKLLPWAEMIVVDIKQSMHGVYSTHIIVRQSSDYFHAKKSHWEKNKSIKKAVLAIENQVMKKNKRKEKSSRLNLELLTN